MATVERKRVTLHPLKEDGTVDPKICLYPKTFIDGIVNRDGDLVKVATAEDLEEKADKEELAEKANNNEVVHLEGDETISGEKTFFDDIKLYGSSLTSETRTGNTSKELSVNVNGITLNYLNKLIEKNVNLASDNLTFSSNSETKYQGGSIEYTPDLDTPENSYTLSFPEKSGTIALAEDTPGGADKRNNKWDKVITKFTTLDLTDQIYGPDGQTVAATLENKVIFTNNTDHDLYLAFSHNYSREINNRKSEYNKDGHNDTLGKQKYYPSRYDLVGQPKELSSAKCIAPGESVTLWDLLEPDHFYSHSELNEVGEIAQNIGFWSNSKVIAYGDQIRDFYESYYDHSSRTEDSWNSYMIKLRQTSKFRNACDNFGFCTEVSNTTLKKLNERISLTSGIVSKDRSKPKVVHALLGSRNATKKIYICERIKNKEDDERAGYRCGKVYMALQLHIGTLAMTADENGDWESAVRRFITFSFRPFFTETYKKEPFNVFFKRTLGPEKI